MNMLKFIKHILLTKAYFIHITKDNSLFVTPTRLLEDIETKLANWTLLSENPSDLKITIWSLLHTSA